MVTLKEMKSKVLSVIEEISPNSTNLTEDPDIATKFNYVTNQIMYELARIKKIAKYVETEVSAGRLITFEDIEKACGYEVFQLGAVKGVKHSLKADGTIIKALESGIAEIDVFVYPEKITEKTGDNYEFELSPDVLEIMPYGIAADLLKSDVSAEYGKIYADRYENMLHRLDTRYHTAGIYVEGGVDI